MCSPPPRDKANQQVIWNGLADGLFTVFSSDHAPFRYDGREGKKPGGEEVAVPPHPERHPGHRDAAAAAVFRRRARRPHRRCSRFVELTATNPAKAYGLHPRKGTIAVGSDADLVVWDERELVLSNADLHHAVDYTPYEGMTLQAWPGLTLARGEVVWDGTPSTGRAGRGRFLRLRRAPLLPRRRSQAMTRLLLINPNISDSVSELIARRGASAAPRPAPRSRC